MGGTEWCDGTVPHETGAIPPEVRTRGALL
jgi:hypothetical protein